MSVSIASVGRLGTVVACALAGAKGRPVSQATESALFDVALAIHEGQRQAFSKTYRGEDPGLRITSAELESEVDRQASTITPELCEDAAKGVGNLFYNMVSNGGTDFGEKLETARPLLEAACRLGAQALGGVGFGGRAVGPQDHRGGSGGNVIQGRFGSRAAPARPDEFDAAHARDMGRVASMGTSQRPEQAPRVNYTREQAIKEIRAGLKARTGTSWSVKGGTGTAYGWIRVDAPPARQVCDHDGFRTRSRAAYLKAEGSDKYLRDIDDKDFHGSTCMVDRKLLGDALGLGRPSNHQGESILSGGDYYQEYVDRAHGRTPSRIGTPYWD